MKKAKEIKILDFETDGGSNDRAVTGTLCQSHGFECSVYQGGFVSGYVYNFGNLDNTVKIYCVSMVDDIVGNGLTTLKEGDTIYSIDVISSDNVSEKVAFNLEIPNINMGYWKWCIKVQGTTPSVNGILYFSPTI